MVGNDSRVYLQPQRTLIWLWRWTLKGKILIEDLDKDGELLFPFSLAPKNPRLWISSVNSSSAKDKGLEIRLWHNDYIIHACLCGDLFIVVVWMYAALDSTREATDIMIMETVNSSSAIKRNEKVTWCIQLWTLDFQNLMLLHVFFRHFFPSFFSLIPHLILPLFWFIRLWLDCDCVSVI